MSGGTLAVLAMLVPAALSIVSCSRMPQTARAPSIVPSNMSRLGTVNERFQSFNVEMIEVTGGRFWKPYKNIREALKTLQKSAADSANPTGMDPSFYEQRPPTDLSNARLRKLAAALGPAYVRVSGTWANMTYFHHTDTPPPAKPPAGFGGVLTRQQWKGVLDFSKAVDAKIVTSFATGPGTRDAQGNWTPKEARKLLSYTKSQGGSITAAEFMNEPTAAAMGGAPKGYDAPAYGRDVAVFRAFIKQAAPDMVFLGPGSGPAWQCLDGGFHAIPQIGGPAGGRRTGVRCFFLSLLWCGLQPLCVDRPGSNDNARRRAFSRLAFAYRYG